MLRRPRMRSPVKIWCSSSKLFASEAAQCRSSAARISLFSIAVPFRIFRTHASQRLLRRQDDLSASHRGRQGNDSADLERLHEWMMRIIYGNARLIYGNVFPKSV